MAGVKITQKEMTDCEKEFPFTSNFKLKYNSAKIIHKQNTNNYAIDLSQWFKHIYIPHFNAAKRATAFYPDFVFFDEYKYYLKFDKNISVTDTAAFNFETETAFGIYKLTCKQVQPNVILLQSTFVANANKVEADKVSGVQTIYNFIEALNQKQLVVKAE